MADSGIFLDVLRSSGLITDFLKIPSAKEGQLLKYLDGKYVPYTPSFLFAKLMSTVQPSSAGDHIVYDTVYKSTDDIVMDTTSPYITTPGSSIGRWTLPAGKDFVVSVLIEGVDTVTVTPQIPLETYNLTDDTYVEIPLPSVSNEWARSYSTFIPLQEDVKQYETRFITNPSAPADIKRVCIMIQEV